MDIRNKDSPVVYICSKFRGNVEHNLEMARRYSRFAADSGCVPLTPHLWLPHILSEETERELAMRMDLRLLERCDEIWVCGDEVSEGMAVEIAYAKEAGIPARYVKHNHIGRYAMEPSHNSSGILCIKKRCYS